MKAKLSRLEAKFGDPFAHSLCNKVYRALDAVRDALVRGEERNGRMKFVR